MAHWKARVEFLLSLIELLFTARRNARIASAVLAIAIPSVRPSVRPPINILIPLERQLIALKHCC